MLIKGVHSLLKVYTEYSFLLKVYTQKYLRQRKVSNVQRTAPKCTPKSIKTYTEAYTIKTI